MTAQVISLFDITLRRRMPRSYGGRRRYVEEIAPGKDRPSAEIILLHPRVHTPAPVLEERSGWPRGWRPF